MSSSFGIPLFRLINFLLNRIPWQRRWSQNFWGNATEVLFDSLLTMIGVVVFVWGLVGQWQSWPGYVPMNLSHWMVRTVLCGGLVSIGSFRLARMLLVHTGSAEQRNSLLQNAFDLDYLLPSDRLNEHHPSVPVWNREVLSAGSKLRYRLKSVRQSSSKLIGLISFTLLMVIVSTVMVGVIWGDWRFGQLDRMVLMVGLLLAMLGLTFWLTWQTAKGLVRQVRLGPTLLELSQHPIRPGESCQVFLRQKGDIRLDCLIVLLECREEATYQQGTDVCTKRAVVFSDTLVESKNVSLSQGSFEQLIVFQLPEEVMHSFTANNNQVTWRIVVSGVKAGCPEFNREFPIIVLPPSPNPPSMAR